MKARGLTRIAVGTGAAIALVAGGALAAHADDEHGTGDVDVSVAIEAIDPPGTLSMSIAGTSTALAEDGSTEQARRFTGALPTVTVTDTRNAEQIPDGVGWAVLGSATDFAGDAGQPAIAASNLGWEPALVAGDQQGLVSEGIAVEPAIDGGAGLVDRELLVSTFDSGDVAPEGTFSANANLVLKTPADVAPGAYAATITLSLFE